MSLQNWRGWPAIPPPSAAMSDTDNIDRQLASINDRLVDISKSLVAIAKELARLCAQAPKPKDPDS